MIVTTLDDVLAHADHLRSVMGINHVALGTDFDGGILAPADLRDYSDLPKLTAALLDHGWEPADVRAFLGENVVRVLEQTWKGELTPDGRQGR